MPNINCSAGFPQRRHDNCFKNGEPNRIVHGAFILNGTVIDYSTPATIKTSVLAAETAGNAIIVRNINGTKSAPTIKEGKGAGLQVKRIVGKEHTITAVDIQWINNVRDWNGLEDIAPNYFFIYWTSNYVWVTAPTALFLAVQDQITDDITTQIEATFIVTWTQSGNPINYASPARDFVIAPELTFSSLGSGTGTEEATLSGSTITLSGTNDELSVKVNFTPTATAYELDHGSVLPTGITLSAQGELSGNITTSGLANGTYKFTVVGIQESTGTQGKQEITLIIS